MDTNNSQSKDKISLGLSVFIAFCVIALFCAISLAVARNIDGLTKQQQVNYFSLPSLEQDENSKNLYL